MYSYFNLSSLRSLVYNLLLIEESIGPEVLPDLVGHSLVGQDGPTSGGHALGSGDAQVVGLVGSSAGGEALGVVERSRRAGDGKAAVEAGHDVADVALIGRAGEGSRVLKVADDGVVDAAHGVGVEGADGAVGAEVGVGLVAVGNLLVFWLRRNENSTKKRDERLTPRTRDRTR